MTDLEEEIGRLQRESKAWEGLAAKRQDRIKELEGQNLALNMHNKQLSTTGSIAMDKVEELLAKVVQLESELDGMYEDQAGESI